MLIHWCTLSRQDQSTTKPDIVWRNIEWRAIKDFWSWCHSRLSGWPHWVVMIVGCLVSIVAVQAAVIASTRDALYDHQEYLFYPSGWLETIRIGRLKPLPSPAKPALNVLLEESMDIPPLTFEIKQYRVQQGDHFSGIANKFGLSLDTIASLNRVEGVGVHLLAVDEVISIPNQDGLFLLVGEDFEGLCRSHNLLSETVLLTNQVLLAEISSETKLFFPGVQHQGRELSLAIGVAFEAPVEGWVSSRYGPRSDPFSGYQNFHRGIDIASPFGAFVRATQGGRVAVVGYNKVLGNYVIVSHFLTGYSSLYGHLSRIRVSRGENVQRNHRLGDVGSSGRSTGPHLHFEIRKGNIHLNPERLIPNF